MTLESDLRKKVLRNSLEVEDLLDVAKLGSPADAAFLENMAQTYEWPLENNINGNHVVPLGRWVQVVCEFLKGSYPAVVRLAVDPSEGVKHSPFVLSLLEQLHTREAVNSVIHICRNLLESSVSPDDLLAKCTSSINLLLSFKPWLEISEGQSSFLRGFLHSRLKRSLSNAEYASVICALRGVGDAQSIKVIESAPSLEQPWADVKSVAVRAIKKRLSGTRRK